MRRTAATAFLLLLAACGGTEPAPVRDAVVSLPAVAGRPGAAYFTLGGSQAAGDALVGVESSKAERIELHRSVRRGAAMSMERVAEVPLGAEDKVFAPGGDHAMVFGLDPQVRAGGTLPLRFRFRSGRTVAVEAEIVPPGAHPGH
jgi:copper(I)-binding protein